MSRLLTAHGEEYFLRTALNDLTAATSIQIGLYNDATDAIADTDDLAAITTEPSDGNYARKTGVGIPTAVTIAHSTGTVDFDIDDQVFDVTNTTGTVDSYFVVINFDADYVTADSSATDHLIFTGALSKSYDLSNYTELTVQDSGGAQE